MNEEQSIILVVQGGAGDVLAATPMIRGFRTTYPDDEIVVLSTHEYMLKNNKNIDRLLSFNSKDDIQVLYNQFVHENNKIRFFKHHFPYDSFLDTPRLEANTLPEFICHLYNIGYDRKPLEYTITPYETAGAIAFMQQFQKPVIILHLTGILPMKSLDSGIMAPIVDRLKEKYDFVQIGSREEADRGLVVPGVHNALGMPIRDTISILPYSRQCILIESVFAHVSNALGLKSIVIFKSTSPEFFGYSNHLNVWDSNGCKEWPCDRPIGPLNKFLPAYLDLATGQPLPWMCPDPKCSKISTELLEKTLMGALEEHEKTGPFNSVQEAMEA